MPEFYDNGECRYMLRAQPYLAAIARGVRDEATSRAFLLEGTHYALAYADAEPLWRDQWKERDEYDSMKCPFWSNYFYPRPCQSCDCRINKSVRMEIDAIFFLRNAKGKKLAIHIEFKRDYEDLKPGQAEAYKPRAACFQEERRKREGLLKHDHFITVIFCGTGTDIPFVERHFDRVISHEKARKKFANYPAV